MYLNVIPCPLDTAPGAGNYRAKLQLDMDLLAIVVHGCCRGLLVLLLFM